MSCVSCLSNSVMITIIAGFKDSAVNKKFPVLSNIISTINVLIYTLRKCVNLLYLLSIVVGFVVAYRNRTLRAV